MNAIQDMGLDKSLKNKLRHNCIYGHRQVPRDFDDLEQLGKHYRTIALAK